jgi:hypothetical protein
MCKLRPFANLLIYRVLLDDVLAAVDSHVARHIFGMYHGFLIDFDY